VTIRKAAWQLLREQLIPFVVAGAVTLLVWAFVNEEGQGWTLATRLGALGPWAGFLAGAAAGWHRIRSGQKTSQALSTIETNVRRVLTDFDVRMSDAVGYITGGEAVPYLWGLPDSAGTDKSPRVTVLGGKQKCGRFTSTARQRPKACRTQTRPSAMSQAPEVQEASDG
jgi:hypothetical protein